jgi:hypothetical protein
MGHVGPLQMLLGPTPPAVQIEHEMHHMISSGDKILHGTMSIIRSSASSAASRSLHIHESR